MYPASTAQRLGAGAGAGLTVLLGVLTFVGPWRVFAISSGGTVPVRVLESTAGSPFVLGAVGTLFVGFLAGSAYPHLLADDEEADWGELAMNIFAVPMAVVMLGFVGVLLAPAGTTLLAGAVTEALLQALVGLLMALLFGGLAGTIVAVYVGVPALVGVYVGVFVGRAAVPESAMAE